MRLHAASHRTNPVGEQRKSEDSYTTTPARCLVCMAIAPHEWLLITDPHLLLKLYILRHKTGVDRATVIARFRCLYEVADPESLGRTTRMKRGRRKSNETIRTRLLSPLHSKSQSQWSLAKVDEATAQSGNPDKAQPPTTHIHNPPQRETSKHNTPTPTCYPRMCMQQKKFWRSRGIVTSDPTYCSREHPASTNRRVVIQISQSQLVVGSHPTDQSALRYYTNCPSSVPSIAPSLSDTAPGPKRVGDQHKPLTRPLVCSTLMANQLRPSF